LADINKYAPHSGRFIREDGTIVNLADYITVDEEGKLRVSATIEAEIADSKIKGSPDGTNWVPIKVGADGSLEVQLKGSYPEYRQLSTDPEPDAATAGKGATIYQIDTGIAKMSNGTAWEVL
jgi:hypothetical protein